MVLIAKALILMFTVTAVALAVMFWIIRCLNKPNNILEF